MNLFDPTNLTVGLIAPALLLVVLAILVPRAIFMRMRPTLTSVAINLAISATILTLTGAGLFAALYAVQGQGVSLALLDSPGSAILQFVRLGLASALIWAPVLALVAFGLAQRTEV